MQEIITQLFGYVWGAWRYRWYALVVSWVIALGGWIFVFQLPEAYVATARLYVDTSSVLRPLLRGLTVQPDISERVTMMSRTLLSRPNLEKLMRMTDLDLQVNNEREQEDLLNELRESIRLSGDSQNLSLYSIQVQHHDRDLAKRITQALITVFIENSLRDKRADTSGAQDFLDEQIAEYEERLISAEARLAKFKQANVDVVPGGGVDYYARLQTARSELSVVELRLQEMENRKRELQRQLSGEEPVFLAPGGAGQPSSPMAVTTPLDQRIQALRTQLDSLLTRFTERHPEVRQLQQMLDELEQERQVEYERLRRAPTTSSGFQVNLGGNPVYDGMRAMLAKTEADIAELNVRVEEYRRRVTELERRVNVIPEVEAELKQLDRDYQVVVSQHREMLERRESARLSGDIEQNASDVTFRVIEPPFVPSEPSEPNKVLLNAGVLIVAIGLGVGVAFMLTLVNPVVSDLRTLEAVSGLPVLGVVPMAVKPEESRKQLISTLAFSSFAFGLVVVCVGVVVSTGMLMA